MRFADQYSIIPILRKQGVLIGDNCRIYIKHIGEPSLVKIGNHVTIASDVRLLTHDGAVWVARQKDVMLNLFGIIEIRDNSFIGTRSIILPNTVIGPNAIVGAGSVVTKDVPPGKIVAGNPARIVGSIDDYIEKATRKKIIFPCHIREQIKNERDLDLLDKYLTKEIIDEIWKKSEGTFIN